MQAIEETIRSVEVSSESITTQLTTIPPMPSRRQATKNDSDDSDVDDGDDVNRKSRAELYNNKSKKTVDKLTVDKPSPTTVVSGKCSCSLASPDCLSAVACLPSAAESHAIITVGVLTRQIIQEKATFTGRDDPLDQEPIRDALRMSSATVWRDWPQKNRLPFRYADTVPSTTTSKNSSSSSSSSNKKSDSTTTKAKKDKKQSKSSTKGGTGKNEKKDKTTSTSLQEEDKYCVTNRLKGKNCFFKAMTQPEDLEDIEIAALEATSVPPEVKVAVKNDLVLYRELRRKKRPNELPALGHLLTFAHLVRLRFNRRSNLKEFYEKHLHTQVGKQAAAAGTNNNSTVATTNTATTASKNSNVEYYPIRVSLQIGAGADLHYYMDALEQVEFMTGRPVEVYLSSTDNKILDLIEDKYQSLIHRFTWKYLVLSPEETATDYARTAEMWLLSHGEVFVVGQLGTEWLLATARHNRFVPYLSIGGHGICEATDSSTTKSSSSSSSIFGCELFAGAGAGASQPSSNK